MIGQYQGVQKRTHDACPDAIGTHCLVCNLNLSVKDVNGMFKLVKNNLDNVCEIIKLMKFSPKRETLLEKTKNLEAEGELPLEAVEKRVGQVKKLANTRWTI